MRNQTKISFYALGMALLCLCLAKVSFAQTVTLSAIPGVTVYNTEAAAISGAVDSAAAIDTYLAARSPTASSHLVINCDGWVYCNTTLVACPVGGNTDWQRASGTASAGCVWAKANNLVGLTYGLITNPSFIQTGSNANGPVSGPLLAQIVDQNVTFTNLTFDGNNLDSDSNTNGVSQPILSLHGIRNCTLTGCSLLNSVKFCTQFSVFDTINIINSNCDVGTTPRSSVNKDGWHFNGPGQYVNINGGTVRAWDDAVALNAQDSSTGILYGGGPIAHVRISNLTLNNSWHAVRFAGYTQQGLISDVVIDGLNGTVMNYGITGQFGTAGYVGLPGYTLAISNISIRNINLQAFNTFSEGTTGAKGRIYFDYANLDNVNIDLSSITPATADAGSIPTVYISSACVFPIGYLLSAGDNYSSLFSDTFTRADAAAGGVSNGWADRSSAFAITTNRLAATVTDGANHFLTRSPGAGAGQAVDQSYRWSLTDYGNENPLLYVGDNSTNFYTLRVKNAGTTLTGTANYAKNVSGTNTTLYSFPFLNVSGHVFQTNFGHLANWLYGQIIDVTAQRLASPIVAFSDSSLSGTTLSYIGLGDNAQASSSPLYLTNYQSNALVQTALTGHSVSVSPESATGTATATATSLPLGAVATVGTWSLSGGYGSATVNPFGQITGLPVPITSAVTVTYTADGFTASAVISPLPTVPGRSRRIN